MTAKYKPHWRRGKYNHFLQFLGLRITDEWFLLRAIHYKYGGNAAKTLLASAIILSLEYGAKNNKQTIDKIIKATVPSKGDTNEQSD